MVSKPSECHIKHTKYYIDANREHQIQRERNETEKKAIHIIDFPFFLGEWKNSYALIFLFVLLKMFYANN